MSLATAAIAERQMARNHFGAVSVKWYGAQGDGVTDDQPAIQAALNAATRIWLPPGTYALGSPILYQKEQVIVGINGNGFGGTILKPTGDFAALSRDTGVSIDYTRNRFQDLMIDGTNLSTAYLVQLEQAYLTNFVRCYFLNGALGVSLIDSDGIAFVDSQMIGFSDTIANLEGATHSIQFVNTIIQGAVGQQPKFLVNVEGSAGAGTVTSMGAAQVVGGQFERVAIQVQAGNNVVLRPNKFAEGEIHLGPRSAFCEVDGAMLDTRVVDQGTLNTVRNLQSAASGVFGAKKVEFPGALTPTSDYFGDGLSEALFLTTAAPMTRGAAGITVELQDNASNVLDSFSPADFPTKQDAYGGTGALMEQHMSALVPPTGGVKAVVSATTGIGAAMIRAYQNLLVNGSNPAGAGWTAYGTTTLSTDADGFTVLTATTNPIIYQYLNLDNGGVYALLARVKTGTQIAFGNLWDGTDGARYALATWPTNGLTDAVGSQVLMAVLTGWRVGVHTTIAIGYQGTPGTAPAVDWAAVVKLN